MEEYLLQTFSSTSLSDKTTSGDRKDEGSEKSKGQGPTSSAGLDGAEVDAAFSQEMETFMREIGIDPSTLPSNETIDEESEERDPEKEREAEEMFKRLWEAISTSGDLDRGSEMDGTKAASSNTDGSTSQVPPKGKGFQDVLRPVMDKMKESEESNTQVCPFNPVCRCLLI